MLSLAAGCVGAVGYLRLGQIFVANMTGNTVLLGLALGQAKGQAALRAVIALAGFVVGVAAGAAIVWRDPERSTWSPGVTAALELVVLGAFAVGWFLAGAEPDGREVYPLIDRTAGPGDGHPERRREAPGHPRRGDHLHNWHPDGRSDRPAASGCRRRSVQR